MGSNYKYTPSHIANSFLSDKKIKINNLKLNKIVYITLGYSLSLFNKDLFRENIEAWKYGPVIPSLYHEFKTFKNANINRLSVIGFGYNQNKVDKNDKDTLEIIEAIKDLYATKTGTKLIALTHSKGTPWSIYYQENASKTIPKSVIKKYYRLFLNV